VWNNSKDWPPNEDSDSLTNKPLLQFERRHEQRLQQVLWQPQFIGRKETYFRMKNLAAIKKAKLLRRGHFPTEIS
jgi:hypothetical protein